MTIHTKTFPTVAALLLSGWLIAFAAPAVAEEATPGAALWRVHDADTTVYLYGLPNVMDADTSWRNAAFGAALNEADAVILEADRTSPEARAALQQTVPRIGIYRDGRTLTAVLDEKTHAQAERVARSLGIPFQALDPLKPWLAANQLQSVMVQGSGLMNPATPAAFIASHAAETGKPISYFEGTTTLLVAVDELPEESQLRMFEQALDIIENDPGQPQRILSLWAAGDVDGLAEAFHGEDAWADKAARSTMLLERNAVWQARLEGILDSETGVYFAAVGVGHLVGDNSLVTGLVAAGHSVVRE